MSSSKAAAALVAQRASFGANFLAPFCFGIYLLLAITTIRRQVQKARSSKQYTQRFIILYTTVMLCLACLWIVTGTVYAEYAGVEIPTNPALLAAVATCDPMAILRVLSRTLIIWMSDGMLLWRAYIIWDGRKAIIAFPLLIYLASIGIGLAFEFSCLGAEAGSPISTATTLDLALPFFGLSIGLTVVNTSLITYKLYAHRRALRYGGLGTDDALATYTSIVNILVESGSLYTGIGIIFLALQATKVPASIPFSVLFTSSAFIAPTLIQLRIVSGAAYSEESRLRALHANSSVTLGPMRFRSETMQKSTFENTSKLEVA